MARGFDCPRRACLWPRFLFHTGRKYGPTRVSVRAHCVGHCQCLPLTGPRGRATLSVGSRLLCRSAPASDMLWPTSSSIAHRAARPGGPGRSQCRFATTVSVCACLRSLAPPSLTRPHGRASPSISSRYTASDCRPASSFAPARAVTAGRGSSSARRAASGSRSQLGT